METQAYLDNELVAGEIHTAQKTASAGTYHIGMLLGRVDATGVYGAYASGDATGLQNIRAVVAQDRVLSAQGALVVYITGSELAGSGLVTTANTALTVTSTIIENAQDSGIIIK